MTTERLAALLHDADCQPNHLYCDGQRCEDIAARLIASGVRVYDPAQYLTGVSDEECLSDDIAHMAARHQGVRVGDDAGGLRALRLDFESLRTTAREQMETAGALSSGALFEGQVYAYDEVLRRIDTALAAQPAPTLDRERLARALISEMYLLRKVTPGCDPDIADIVAAAIADAYEADR